MAVFRVYDIVWGAGGNAPRLPSEAQVACVDMGGIAAALSDTFGWLVADFKATLLSEISQEGA